MGLRPNLIAREPRFCSSSMSSSSKSSSNNRERALAACKARQRLLRESCWTLHQHSSSLLHHACGRAAAGASQPLNSRAATRERAGSALVSWPAASVENNLGAWLCNVIGRCGHPRAWHYHAHMLLHSYLSLHVRHLQRRKMRPATATHPTLLYRPACAAAAAAMCTGLAWRSGAPARTAETQLTSARFATSGSARTRACWLHLAVHSSSMPVQYLQLSWRSFQ